MRALYISYIDTSATRHVTRHARPAAPCPSMNHGPWYLSYIRYTAAVAIYIYSKKGQGRGIYRHIAHKALALATRGVETALLARPHQPRSMWISCSEGEGTLTATGMAVRAGWRRRDAASVTGNDLEQVLLGT